MTIRLSLLLLLCSSQALAAPWLGGPEVDDDDAIADAPAVDEGAVDSDRAAHPLDLRVLAGTLEDGVRRVVVDGVDPVQALPLDLRAAPDTTAAELRGLLTGSGARQVKLHGVEVHGVLWSGNTAAHGLQATLLPGASSVLLALAPLPPPQAPQPTTLPGGLGKTWTSVQAELEATLRQGRCAGLPLATDEVLATVVPPAFLERAQRSRDRAAIERAALCARSASAPWDRLELRLEALHFNLFDDSGALRGGLLIRVDPSTGAFAYPLFKTLAK